MALIFISHSSLDNEKIKPIIQTIKEHKFDSIFLDFDDESGIKVGEEWEKRIYNEIQRSHVMLILITPAWIASKWCFAEYRLAKSLGKEIIPIIVEHGKEREIDKWIDSHIQSSDFSKDKKVLSKVIARIRDISIDTQKGFHWDINRSPYPGLIAFDEEDAAIFFGRDRDTKLLIEQLNAMSNNNSAKFLNIVASSGLGKSSLLKAGVIPKLKLSYSERWRILEVFRPTQRPLYEFTKLISKLLNKQKDYKILYESLKSDGYKEVLDDIFTEIEFLSSKKKFILLPIDQAEELYLNINSLEKTYFLRVMSYFLEMKNNFFLIWTLRSDFLQEFQVDKESQFLHKYEKTYSLTTILKEEISLIIREPAHIVGVHIEEELIEKIKEDMQRTDALPLLALCLNELFHHYGKNGLLRVIDYEHLGDSSESNPMENIIRRKANEAITEYLNDDKSLIALKQAFIPHLIRINNQSEYVQRVAFFSDLPIASHKIIETLVKARLLIKKSVDGEVSIEIAHEALIRKWSLLQSWLDEEHEFLIAKTQLESSFLEWEKVGQKNKALLGGLQLEKALVWKNRLNNKEEIYYIEESESYRKKEKKRLKDIYLGAFILVFLFLLMSLYNWNKANGYLIRVNQTLEDSTIKQAIIYRDYLNEPLKAKLLFAKLITQSKERDIRRLKILYNSINQNVKLIDIREHFDSFNGVVKGKKYATRLLVWTLDNEVQLLDMNGHKKLCSLKHNDEINGAVFNKDETKILSWSGDGTIKVFNIEKKRVEKVFLHTSKVLGVKFSRDEQKILSWGSDNNVKVWNIDGESEPINIFRHKGEIKGAFFMKEDNYLLSWNNKTITLWNRTNNKALTFLHNNSVVGVRLNQDGTKILSWSKDYTVRLWSLKERKVLKKFVHQGAVQGAIFDKNETRILSWSRDKTLRLWDIKNEQEIQVYRHRGSINGATFYNDETQILAWGGEENTQTGEVKLWDLETAEKVFSFVHDSVVYIATFNKESNIIESWSSNWDLKKSEQRIWQVLTTKKISENMGKRVNPKVDNTLDWQGKKEITTYSERDNKVYKLKHYDQINGAIFSRDKERILSWSNDTTIKLWSKNSTEPILVLTHDTPVMNAIFSQDESMILSWSSDNNIRLWDIEGNLLLNLLRKDIKQVSFNTDENKILIYHSENNIETYTLYKQRNLKREDYLLEVARENAITLKKSGEIQVLNASEWTSENKKGKTHEKY